MELRMVISLLLIYMMNKKINLNQTTLYNKIKIYYLFNKKK